MIKSFIGISYSLIQNNQHQQMLTFLFHVFSLNNLKVKFRSLPLARDFESSQLIWCIFRHFKTLRCIFCVSLFYHCIFKYSNYTVCLFCFVFLIENLQYSSIFWARLIKPFSWQNDIFKLQWDSLSLSLLYLYIYTCHLSKNSSVIFIFASYYGKYYSLFQNLLSSKVHCGKRSIYIAFHFFLFFFYLFLF